MKSLGLYFLLSYITGNPLLALIALVLLYGVLDRLYLGLLPDIFKPLKRNRQIRNYQVQLTNNPSDADSAFRAGVLLFEKHRYKKAYELLQEAAKKIEDSARLYQYMGMTQVEMGNAETGCELLEKALELDKKVGYGLPYIYLINSETNRQNPDKSRIEKLKERIESFSNIENLYRMGAIYKKQGNGKEAAEMFHHAIKDYAYCPRKLRRMHRRWAFLSRLALLTVNSRA